MAVTAMLAVQLANALTQPNATATKVAVFVTLTSDPDHIAFERLVRESSDGFASVDIVSERVPIGSIHRKRADSAKP